jgi:hypothetical protein
MSDNKLLVAFAGGAAASLVTGFPVPKEQPSINDAIPVIEFASIAPEPALAPVLNVSLSTRSATITLSEAPKKWTVALDREFRSLALEEAQGTISEENARRLRQLEALRERLVAPRTSEEILLQLKRDRMLEQFSKTFEDYVQFKASAYRPRPKAA